MTFAMLATDRQKGVYKTGVINDPLGQTHSPASSHHYCHLKFDFLFEISKVMTDVWMVTLGRPSGSNIMILER